MYAVIKTGGKQYRVAADEVLTIEKVAGDAGAKVEFTEVLMVAGSGDPKLGKPTICGRQGHRRGGRAGPRAQGHRLQEAAPQELAPQARPPPGADDGAHQGNHRRLTPAGQ